MGVKKQICNKQYRTVNFWEKYENFLKSVLQQFVNKLKVHGVRIFS